jgi:type II secretory pathway component PulK
MGVASWFLWLQERLKVHAEESRSAEALAMAHSGIAVALNPKVDRFSSLLEAQLGPDTGYRVRIEGEGGRVNLGWILAGEDPQRIAIFKQWLEFVIGIDPQARDRLVDCLLDYVDADNVSRLNGQEDAVDYHPANRMIQSLAELKRIPAMEPLLAYEGWEDLLTMDSAGPFDLRESPEGVLRLLPGFGEAQVQRWLQVRAGMDQQLHTIDDPKFTGVDQVLAAIGIDQRFRNNLAPLVTINESTVRILAEGYSAKVVRQVQVVVRKGTGKSQIRSWTE